MRSTDYCRNQDEMGVYKLTFQVSILHGSFVILGLKCLQDDGHEQDQQHIVPKHHPRKDEDQGSKVCITLQIELNVIIVFQGQDL